jgi:hypothetical protein
MNNEINFDADKVDALRRAYNHALEIKAEAFTFEGNAILTSYAKYLLEYLSTKFPPKV